MDSVRIYWAWSLSRLLLLNYPDSTAFGDLLELGAYILSSSSSGAGLLECRWESSPSYLYSMSTLTRSINSLNAGRSSDSASDFSSFSPITISEEYYNVFNCSMLMYSVTYFVSTGPTGGTRSESSVMEFKIFFGVIGSLLTALSVFLFLLLNW